MASRNLSFAFLLLAAAAPPAQAQSNQANPRPSGSEAATTSQPRTEYDEYAALDRRVVAVEAKLEALKESSANLALLLSLIAIGFGGLITGIVVFFALRTERTAAAAATHAARTELATERADVEANVRAVEANVQAADAIRAESQEILNKIRSGHSEAEAHLSKMRAAAEAADKYHETIVREEAVPLSPEDEAALSEGAELLAEKEPKDWTSEDYRVLISEALSKDDYRKAGELAILLRYFNRDDSSVAYSLAMEGVAALGEDQYALAQDRFLDVENTFGGSTDAEVRKSLRLARLNRAVAAWKAGQEEEAVRLCDELISRTQESTEAADIITNLRAQFTKGMVYRNSDNLEGAVESVHLQTGYWNHEDPLVVDQVAANVRYRALLLEQSGRFVEARDVLVAGLAQLQQRADMREKAAEFENTLRRVEDRIAEGG